MSLLPVIRTWEAWRPVFTDPGVWRHALHEICRRHGLSPAGRITAGFPGTCAVFRVGQHTVVKFYPPMCRRDFDRERECYGLLSSCAEIPIPRLLASGILQDAVEWPYIATEFRPGDAIRDVFDRIPQENRLAIAREIGRALGAIHRTPVDRITSMPTNAGAWRAFLDTQKANCAAAHRRAGALPDALCAGIPAFLESAEPLLPGRLCLLNGDLTEDHLLLVRQNGRWRISALIDLADAEVGGPHYEWGALWFGMFRQNSGMMQAFMAAYDPAVRMDTAWRRQAMAYTLLHRFGAEIVRIAIERTQLSHPLKDLSQLQNLLWPPQLQTVRSLRP